MSELGFIREALDIKILILFVICRLPAPIGLDGLSQLVMVDGGFNYFDFTDSLYSLEQTGHVLCENGKYKATEKGHKNSAIVEGGLPNSVRQKALAGLSPVVTAMRRDAMIKTTRGRGKDGNMLELSLSDGLGEMLCVRLLVADDETTERFECRFRDDPEGFYGKIIELLDKG